MNALSPHRRRAAFAFIFITVLIDILSFGIVIPVLPHLLEELTGSIAHAAIWAGVISTMFAAIQFFSSPIQGALSDRFGRRPVILLSNLGLGIDFALMALAPSLWLLFIGRAMSGLTAASFSTANAYIADVTPAEKRAGVFGMLGAAFGIGFVIGPALGGVLGDIDIRLPFWVAAGLAVLNFCYGYFVLPESLPPEKRSPRFDFKTAHPIGTLKFLGRHPLVLGLAMLVFLSQLAHYVLQSTFVLYTDFRYAWGPREVGYVLALVGICSAIVQAWLTGKLAPRLGERRLLLYGLGFGALSLLMMGLAASPWLLVASIPVMALWGLAEPATQSMMTQQISPEEQGRLQGALSSLMAFAGIFGPTLFTQIFAWSIRTPQYKLPGAAFLVGALILAGCVLFAWRLTRRIAVSPAQTAGESAD
ncbi:MULTISPECIES: TCR/Tet family MFS transporter [Oleiagrimonas]|uniref:TCR/Tet family MFS transporter n=1 Tax=Oleiagrimonas citrea TaxID=1665687 RepID=A0A846ZL62_9GAMM|nr:MULTISPECIES: TCR/Tet family MFS transporter [Oleiagrimonas]NKZ38552.1 TCR/Tet family MFS transporter [Oleiagrimonas citrea]RAP58207.1 tetracycline resistance MFS efflux pump [Oleiagrimonas sp. MCCC 1A03011]